MRRAHQKEIDALQASLNGKRNEEIELLKARHVKEI